MNDAIETETVPSEALTVHTQESGAIVAASSVLDMEPAQFKAGLDRRKSNRASLMEWVRSALVEGTDFGRISTKRGPSKPSLWKPGAEKICGMLGVIVTFPNLRDYEQAALSGVKLENIILRCEIIGSSGGIVASGVGARSLSQDSGDLNKCLKMAEKSAHIDATLRMAGLSEVFTQDLEDMKPPRSPGKVQSTAPPPQNAPTVTQTPKKGIPVPFPTPESRQKMIAVLKAGPGEPNREIVCEYFQKLENPSALMPNEPLEELDLRFVPATVKQMTALASKLAEFGNGERAGWAFPPHPEPEAPKEPDHETVDHSDMEQVTGTIQHVSQKQGTSKKGPWILYGIKICDGWINTFSDRVGALAQQNQGKKVTVWYKTEEKGRTAYDLEVSP